jgi:radical SAM superfamily enzyme YgiQ (UPF0313 family)
MRVLLVNPPARRFVRPHSPSFPLGLGYIAAVLKKEGHTVAIYDAEWNAEELASRGSCQYPLSEMAANWGKYQECLRQPSHDVWREVEGVIREQLPDVVGITCRALDLASAVVVARLAKRANPSVRVVLGGPAATTCSDMVMEDVNVDFAVRGEGEMTMKELVRAVEVGAGDLRSIDGLWFRESRGIVRNKQRELIQDISSLPYPDRESLLNARRLPGPIYRRLMGDLVSSRGCPYRCTFCANHSVWGSRKWRGRSPEDVVGEILHVRDTHGVQHFVFWDDLFTVNRERTVAICELMLAKGANVHWVCLVRANTIDAELLRLMRRSGCVQVQMGVESGSNRILQQMKKGMTVEDFRRAARVIRRSGLPWHCFLLIGIPGETREEMAATMRLVTELRPDVVELSVFAPYPGSPLHEELKVAGLLDSPDWLFADFLNADCCYVGTMSRAEFRDVALQGLRECDEHNRRVERQRSIRPLAAVKRLLRALYGRTRGKWLAS